MGKSNIVELAGREATTDPLSELLRSGAQQLIHRAVVVPEGDFQR